MNPGGRGCGEPRSCHCTPVWVTTAKLCLKKKKKKKKKKRRRRKEEEEEELEEEEEEIIRPTSKKIQKISWARWCVPVIPATQEAEAGELPEPRRWRLQ